jgi:precorrin-6Y C5,15-methyltransferase (decarboxylating)
MSARLSVVGIGADGWPGLGEQSRAAIRAADVIVGSKRQLALVPHTGAEHRPWPSPIDALVDEITEAAVGGSGPKTCVLASGDPMLHGIGATLARRVGPERLTVHPHPSAFALACARLAWPQADTELVSAVGRPAEVVARSLQPGRRLVAYVSGPDGAARLAAVLRERGFGASGFAVLEQLGGDSERIQDTTADAWGDRAADPLHLVAIECRGGRLLARVPGLPDDAFESDGALTKRHVRAITLAALAPAPGQLLWDVGAGSGSIGIEWLRAEPTARAIAIDSRPDRAERAERNAASLGVPHLDVRSAEAPGALEVLDPPDAVFVGGGLSVPGLLDACWQRLAPGGRIVANAVTLEGEHAIAAQHDRRGGTLTRIAIEHAEPLGGFTAWRAQRPVVQWAAGKETE